MKRTLNTLVASLLITLVAGVVVAVPVSASTFNPNKIMDDSVFNRINSMSATAIDVFLNGFANSCISPNSGFRAIDPTGYNPTQGYLYGGFVTAGQVIYDSAQAYGINPQVLVTTLEKEQSLVTGRNNFSGYCNNGDQHKYAAAVGYGCPDSGTTYSYSGVNLYQRNGVTISDTGTTCVNSASKAGFSQQVIRAAWLLKFGQQRSMGNTGWAVIKGSWNNSDDPQTCYGGPMTRGTFARCPSGASAYYDGYTTIDNTAVHIDSGATAAFYWYTPHFHGNQIFSDLFTSWFGSPISPPATSCDSRVSNTVCVWSVREGDGSQFLTSSKAELDSAVNTYGWVNMGINFYASATQSPGTLPVYRLRHNSKYVFTADQSEYANLKATSGWSDEGIAFYTYPSSTSANISHTVYRLYNANTDQYYLTIDTDTETTLLSSGYTLKPNSFNTFSGLADLPVPAAGRVNVYRVQASTNYFYTTSLSELETVLLSGYTYNGVLTTSPASGTGTAVYRLRLGNKYLYTDNAAEKDSAVNRYGFVYEGVGYYLDTSSDEIYRLDNTQTGTYFYTSNVNEAVSTANSSGWVYGGALNVITNTVSPVFRFLNLMSNKHFYTIDINEAMGITNRGWKYETVAFSASNSTGLPVYRLLLNDKHFYTTDVNEKNIAVSTYGYRYEGVGFYVSQTTTSAPVYRLQGGPNEYFYTASSAEKDRAVSTYGYRFESVGFYLSP